MKSLETFDSVPPAPSGTAAGVPEALPASGRELVPVSPRELADFPSGDLAEDVSPGPLLELAPAPAGFDGHEFVDDGWDFAAREDHEPTAAVSPEEFFEARDEIADPVPSLEETEVDSGDDGFGEAPPLAEDPADFAREREAWQQELSRLRAELERHRQLLLDVCEQRSRRAITGPGEEGDLPCLPDVASVMNGLASVIPAPAPPMLDYKPVPALLPARMERKELVAAATRAESQAPAIAAEESESADVTDEDRGAAAAPLVPSTAALMPARRERFTPIALLPCSERTPAAPPAEFAIPVRFWSVALVGLSFSAIAGAIVWASVESAGAAMANRRLDDLVSAAPADPAAIEAELERRRESPMGRWDSLANYRTARALAAVDAARNEDRIVSKARNERGPAIAGLLERARERAPANVWYRLSAALYGAEAAPERWQELRNFPACEPAVWVALGDADRLAGRTEPALESYGKFLAYRPAETRKTLARLAEIRIGADKSLAIVPPNPVAALQAVHFLKDDEGRKDWRERAELLLTQIEGHGTFQGTESLASEAKLRQMLGQNDASADILQRVLERDPQRVDLRLQLAQLRYEQKNYAASGTLVEAVIHADPTGMLGDEARQLRARLEAIEGRPGLAPLPE
ncbi:MAG TPA: tetratricopeptide repeat protein [Planctomycetia bacterium]|nr:tetratricopeptide repeat protein [Planctomycetia bacterium]